MRLNVSVEAADIDASIGVRIRDSVGGKVRVMKRGSIVFSKSGERPGMGSE